MGDIAWAQFSWEAFATLVTGVLAVAAAMVVGFRQLALLEGQERLKAQEIRIDLFDRRLVVYEATKKFLSLLVMHAARAEPAEEQAFLRAKLNAVFLFDPNVGNHLDEIWKRYCAFAALWAEMRALYEREGHYGEGNPQKEMEHLNWFSDAMTNLPSIFEAMHLATLESPSQKSTDVAPDSLHP